MQYLPLLFLPLLASAAPTLTPRAGAPSITPLPPSCPITGVYPTNNSTDFAPTSPFDPDNLLYKYSLDPGSTTPDGTNDTQAVTSCRETCYGYGNPGECKSIWSAHGTGSDDEFVCKLYGANISSADLGQVAEGKQAAQAKAEIIGCRRPE